jgi:hypothetical protein
LSDPQALSCKRRRRRRRMKEVKDAPSLATFS